MCVSTVHTRHMYQHLHAHTVCCVFVCVCLSTPCISPMCNRILAALLFKPLCSCVTSTVERPIVNSRSVCYIVHMIHMVFALRTALEISRVVVSVFFFSPFLCRCNSSPRALCFISLSPWWILACHAESLTLSIMLY